MGLHSLNVSYFKATLIPEINSKPDPNCFIEHITNNYFDRFIDENKNIEIELIDWFELLEASMGKKLP